MKAIKNVDCVLTEQNKENTVGLKDAFIIPTLCIKVILVEE